MTTKHAAEDLQQSEGYFFCSKYGVSMRQEAAHCKDPRIYCKFRPSCLIHFLEKEQRAAKAGTAG